MRKGRVPRTPRTIRITWWSWAFLRPGAMWIGMKSTTSPTPSGVRNRVMRTLESGRYICRRLASGDVAATRKCPPFLSSRIEAKRLGESKKGRHSQSIVPSMPTSAAVWRSPMTP
jgi:hypothetical protein